MTLSQTIKTAEDAAKLAVFIAQHSPPFTVTIVEGEEPRRARQNRFAFEAYKQVAKMLGDRDASEVRAISKLHIGVPIMRAASEAFRADYDAIVKPLPYEAKLKLMVEPFDFAVTRSMNVGQMNDYITAMLRYWDENGAAGAMLERYDL